MRENILNMPHHLRRQRVVTAEQAAMAMAGVYSCSRLDELKAKFPPEDQQHCFQLLEDNFECCKRRRTTSQENMV